jgi:hypothetical protein
MRLPVLASIAMFVLSLVAVVPALQAVQAHVNATTAALTQASAK